MTRRNTILNGHIRGTTSISVQARRTPIRTQNDSSLLQNDLIKLQKWQDKWLMKFNPGKCYTMTLATRTRTPNMYTFCGQTLMSVDSHCYLGIHLSNTLNWKAQTKAASTKAQQTLGVIRRNLNKCPTHIKAAAYTSLVRPILEYASAEWDPHSQNNIKTLERIQRQAARFCTINYSREPGSVTKLLQELGWETLQTRRKAKMEHNIIDIPLDQYIKHNTRCSRKHNSQLLQIRHSSNTFGHSFFFLTTAKRRECSNVIKHNFKQLGRIISKKLKQISDRTLADKPQCALA